MQVVRGWVGGFAAFEENPELFLAPAWLVGWVCGFLGFWVSGFLLGAWRRRVAGRVVLVLVLAVLLPCFCGFGCGKTPPFRTIYQALLAGVVQGQEEKEQSVEA